VSTAELLERPSGPPTGTEVRRRPVAANLGGRAAVIGGFVLMLVVFGITQPDNFIALTTFRNILDQAAVPVILVSGLTFVLVTGEFDLSYTSTIGLGAGLAIVMMTHGWAIGIAMVATMVVSLVIGLLVGVLVTLGRASSFIVTLAVGSGLTGLEQALTDNQTIYQDVPLGFGDIARIDFLGLRLPVWVAIAVLVGTAVLLHATRFGRQARAIGGNAPAAYLAGVRVRRIKIATFVMVAVFSGIVALILTSRAGSYYPGASAGFLLNTYAAAFLGAAMGSQSNFTVAGSAFGVLWLLVLQTGLTLNNQPAWTSNLIQGVVLALAVLIAAKGRRSSA
jgi:ribose transport system permease protein